LAAQTLIHYGTRETHFILGDVRVVVEAFPFTPSKKDYRHLAETLKKEKKEGDYDFIREEEDKVFSELRTQCIVCADITDQKCGYCYRTISPLCANINCRINHTCC
jgi:hypothetical protein